MQTDNEGRFRSDGLVPGMTYELVFVTPVIKESYMVGEARTIETAVSSTAGEVIKGLSLAPERSGILRRFAWTAPSSTRVMGRSENRMVDLAHVAFDRHSGRLFSYFPNARAELPR